MKKSLHKIAIINTKKTALIGRFGFQKNWILPFSVYIYNLNKYYFTIRRFYQCIEITFFKANIVISWGEIEE